MTTETIANPQTIDNKVLLIKTIRNLSGCSLLTAKRIADYGFIGIRKPFEYADVVMEDRIFSSHNDTIARRAIRQWRKDHEVLINMVNETNDFVLVDPELITFITNILASAQKAHNLTSDEAAVIATSACNAARLWFGPDNLSHYRPDAQEEIVEAYAQARSSTLTKEDNATFPKAVYWNAVRETYVATV